MEVDFQTIRNYTKFLAMILMDPFLPKQHASASAGRTRFRDLADAFDTLVFSDEHLDDEDIEEHHVLVSFTLLEARAPGKAHACKLSKQTGRMTASYLF